MYTHFLGIDLHKRSSTWALVDQERKLCHRVTVPVTPPALSKAITELPMPPSQVQATLEPVCGWRWVRTHLEESGVTTKLANATKVRLIAASRHKTDANDARMLAELLASGYLPEAYVAPPPIVDLRSLVRERHYLVEVRTGCKNRLKGVVTATGHLEILEDCLTKRGRAFIERTGLRKLRNLHEIITELTQYIKRLEGEITETLATFPVAPIVASVPTVGPISTATIVAEVGDFSRFASANRLANYAGLVPGQRSSGERQRYGRITKTGSKYLRYTMVECAMRLRPYHDPQLYRWYEGVAQRSTPMRARVALARKLLARIWHCVQSGTPYTPRHDRVG